MTDIKRIDTAKPSYMYDDAEGPYVLYTDHIAALEAVKATVKPLEWFRPDGIHENVVLMRAATRFGMYEAWGGGGWNLDRGRQHIGAGRSLEAAKAAAQAHYDNLILSTLSPASIVAAKMGNAERHRLAAVLRSRGRANSLHDIQRAADMLDAIVTSPALEANQTGESLLDKYLDGPLTSIDRLKLFESDPEQWPLDRDDAENILTALEANQQVIETLRAALERICDLRSYSMRDASENVDVMQQIARAALTQDEEAGK